MAKRRRQDSSRISRLAKNSSNGIGRFLVQMPPGERKSGIPHSVEMPAPVKGTTTRAASTAARSRATPVSRSGAIIYWVPAHASWHIIDWQVRERRRGLHALPSYHAARTRSRRRARLLLQQARPQGGPPPGRREGPLY